MCTSLPAGDLVGLLLREAEMSSALVSHRLRQALRVDASVDDDSS